MRFLCSIALLIIMTALGCQEKQDLHLMVEASIIAGQPVENVRVRILGKRGTQEARLISNAQVKLLSDGVTYLLQESREKPGFYGYKGSDLEITPGQEYMLWVQHDESVAVTTTIIKADTMFKSELNKDPENLMVRN